MQQRRSLNKDNFPTAMGPLALCTFSSNLAAFSRTTVRTLEITVLYGCVPFKFSQYCTVCTVPYSNFRANHVSVASCSRSVRRRVVRVIDFCEWWCCPTWLWRWGPTVSFYLVQSVNIGFVVLYCAPTVLYSTMPTGLDLPSVMSETDPRKVHTSTYAILQASEQTTTSTTTQTTKNLAVYANWPVII